MSKTLMLLAVLVIVAIVTGALAVTSFLRERKGARVQLAEPESAPVAAGRAPAQGAVDHHRAAVEEEDSHSKSTLTFLAWV